MIHHVHQALEQVRTMHRHVIEKQRFKGYSGRGRALSGACALLMAFWLAQRPSRSNDLTVIAWLSLAAVSIAINYGAVLTWFFRDPKVGREARRLKPVIEVVPALLAGAALTAAFWRDGLFDYMVPAWMVLFGLANLACRHVLPREIGWVGFYYILVGTLLLFVAPDQGWKNPWLMGLGFFVGELAGGVILHFDGPIRPHWASFLGVGESRLNHD